MILLLWMLWGPAAETCASISGDRILAKELAAVTPAFGALPGDIDLGPAPLPGLQRRFRHAELARLAAKHRVDLQGVEEVCIERRSRRLTEGELELALRKEVAALGGGAPPRIEILDFSRYPVPEGEMEIRAARPAAGPGAAPSAVQLWRGRVRTDGGRSVPIWVRVRLTHRTQVLTAVRALPAGIPIAGADLLQQEQERPFDGGSTISLSQAVGMVPRRTIQAGAVIRPDALSAAPAVLAREQAAVEVRSGAVRLRLRGVAESAAALGQPVRIRSLDGKRWYQGVVTGKGSVEVNAEVERVDGDSGSGGGYGARALPQEPN